MEAFLNTSQVPSGNIFLPKGKANEFSSQLYSNLPAENQTKSDIEVPDSSEVLESALGSKKTELSRSLKTNTAPSWAIGSKK